MNNAKQTNQMLQEIEGQVSSLMQTLDRLKKNINKDDLTGLLRRDEFFSRVEKLHASGGEVAIIMIDIDNFKMINDTEGHITGDHVLQRVSKVLNRCTKVGAEVGRFGGEEFIIAACCGEERAQNLAEALRRQIEREVSVTVSVGVATTLKANKDLRRTVGMADQALYQAKHAGKNRVCIAA